MSGRFKSHQKSSLQMSHSEATCRLTCNERSPVKRYVISGTFWAREWRDSIIYAECDMLSLVCPSVCTLHGWISQNGWIRFMQLRRTV